MKTMSPLSLSVLALLATSCVASRNPPPTNAEDISAAAIEELRQIMFSSKRFIKLHAAESLLSLDAGKDVFETFSSEEQRFGDVPKYRIVVWRVLARSAPTVSERKAWTRKIADAFLDEQGPDRLHAVESLAKLSYDIPADERSAFALAAGSSDQGEVLFTLWVLAQNGDTNRHIQQIAEYLTSDDMIARLRAGYILRHFRDLSPSVYEQLFRATDREAVDNLASPYLISSAYVVAQRQDLPNESRSYHRKMVETLDSMTPPHRAAIAQGFVDAGVGSDLPLLIGKANDPDEDTRIYINFAIANILRAAD